MIFRQLVLGVSTAMLVLGAAVAAEPAAADEATRIVYRFNDRSVPPQYHRSYTIEVDRASSSCVIDSYGEIISTRKNVESPNLLDELRSLVAVDQQEPCQDLVNRGCTGGTGETLTLLEQGRVALKRSAYRCGREEGRGNHCGLLIAKVKSALANVQCGAK